jgi:hypothetical protein
LKFSTAFLFFSLLLSLSVNAQVTVVEMTTDTISVFEQEEQSEKSIKSARLAMLASAAFPGTGQQYLGKSKSALVFFGMEVLSIFGAVFLEKYSRQLENDAHGYAALHAGVDVRDKDERFWTAVGKFGDMHEYNLNVLYNREDGDLYTSESMNWKWSNGELTDKQYQKRYNNFRDASRKIHIAASICIGAMIINRVASIVDIRATTRYKTRQQENFSFKVTPDFSSDFSAVGINISTGF